MPLPPEFIRIDFQWGEPNGLQMTLSFDDWKALWEIAQGDELTFRRFLLFITEREAYANGWPGPGPSSPKVRAKIDGKTQ